MISKLGRRIPVTFAAVVFLWAAGVATAGEIRQDGADSEFLALILPVIGSTPGAFGAYFKTSVQLYNPNASAYTYRLVFHPGGVPGSASDPSFSGTIPPGTTAYYPDVLPAIGIATGLGSLDVYLQVSEMNLPLATIARVYNDAGSAGTTGFTEDYLPPRKALIAGDVALLVASPNSVLFRFNLGVRSLADGLAMTTTLRSSAGVLIQTVTKSYPADFFQQTTLESFFPGVTLVGNESLTFQVTAGSGIIYGAEVDNITNDPSVGRAQYVSGP